jgi:hypothetical protein
MTCPTRQDLRWIGTARSDRFWDPIEKTAAGNGARWIDLKNQGAYADDEFNDFIHLNGCGGRHATGELARVIQGTPR